MSSNDEMCLGSLRDDARTNEAELSRAEFSYTNFARLTLLKLTTFIMTAYQLTHNLEYLQNQRDYKVFDKFSTELSHIGPVLFGWRFLYDCTQIHKDHRNEYQEKPCELSMHYYRKHRMVNDALWCGIMIARFSCHILKDSTANIQCFQCIFALGYLIDFYQELWRVRDKIKKIETMRRAKKNEAIKNTFTNIRLYFWSYYGMLINAIGALILLGAAGALPLWAPTIVLIAALVLAIAPLYYVYRPYSQHIEKTDKITLALALGFALLLVITLLSLANPATAGLAIFANIIIMIGAVVTGMAQCKFTFDSERFIKLYKACDLSALCNPLLIVGMALLFALCSPSTLITLAILASACILKLAIYYLSRYLKPPVDRCRIQAELTEPLLPSPLHESTALFETQPQKSPPEIFSENVANTNNQSTSSQNIPHRDLAQTKQNETLNKHQPPAREISTVQSDNSLNSMSSQGSSTSTVLDQPNASSSAIEGSDTESDNDNPAHAHYQNLEQAVYPRPRSGSS